MSSTRDLLSDLEELLHAVYYFEQPQIVFPPEIKIICSDLLRLVTADDTDQKSVMDLIQRQELLTEAGAAAYSFRSPTQASSEAVKKKDRKKLNHRLCF